MSEDKRPTWAELVGRYLLIRNPRYQPPASTVVVGAAPPIVEVEVLCMTGDYIKLRYRTGEAKGQEDWFTQSWGPEVLEILAQAGAAPSVECEPETVDLSGLE